MDDDVKQEARKQAFGLLKEAWELIHEFGLCGEFPAEWMMETQSLLCPPDERERDPRMEAWPTEVLCLPSLNPDRVNREPN